MEPRKRVWKNRAAGLRHDGIVGESKHCRGLQRPELGLVSIARHIPKIFKPSKTTEEISRIAPVANWRAANPEPDSTQNEAVEALVELCFDGKACRGSDDHSPFNLSMA